jgi:phage shock protein C
MSTQLSRSRTDAMIAGVCGGLASALAIDAVLVRLFFVLLTLSGGAGVLLYLLLWIIMPIAGEGTFGSEATARTGVREIAHHARTIAGQPDAFTPPRANTALLVGGVLVVVGLTSLLRQLGVPWLGWMHLGTLWPLLIVLAGIALLVRRTQEV